MTAHTSEVPHCHCSLPKRSEEKKVDPPIDHDWPQAPTINTACQAFNQLSKNLRNQASSSLPTASTRAGCGSSAASQRSQHRSCHRGAGCEPAKLHAMSLQCILLWTSSHKREHDSTHHDESPHCSDWDPAQGSLPFAVAICAGVMHCAELRPLPLVLLGAGAQPLLVHGALATDWV